MAKRALLLPLVVAGIGLPLCSAFARSDVEKGRDLAQRMCAACHMQPGQGEKTDHTGIPSFRAVASRPGQSVDGIASWLNVAPPTMPNHHLSHEQKVELAAFIISLREGDR